MKKRHCGSCISFVKWKHDQFGGGLCEYNDWRTSSDFGGGCKDWQPKKYERTKHHNLKDKDYDYNGEENEYD